MTLSKETIGNVIGKLELFAQNLKWTDVRGAQDLLAAAEGLRELLDRRERDKQEPYGYVHQSLYEECGSSGLSNDHEAYRDGSTTHIPLYTAPPAPVVQLVQVQDERASYEAFVEQRLGDCVDRRRAKNGDQEYMAWDMAMGWIVWQGRAAMLKGDQP